MRRGVAYVIPCMWWSLLPGTYTHTDIEAAARSANIHDFIMSLPEQYNTMVRPLP